jgi:hypothetical protein
MIIKTDGNLQITAKGNIEIKSQAGDVKLTADSGYLDVNAAADYRDSCGGNRSSKAAGTHNTQAQGAINHSAGGDINNDGTCIYDQCGKAQPSKEAAKAADANPVGGRDT